MASLSGCGKVERWVSEKADAALAHEIESAVDDLAEGKNHPSGVPNRRKRSMKPDALPLGSAGLPSASAAEAASSAAQPPPGP